MRSLLSLLLVAPIAAFALGAEDTEFYGFVGANSVATLKFVDDPKPWSGNNFVYGNATFKQLALCWTESTKELRQALVCKQSPNGKPTVTYGVAGTPGRQPAYSDDTAEATEYRRVAKQSKLGTGAKRGDATLQTAFVCKSGCSLEVPKYIFEVAKYD